MRQRKARWAQKASDRHAWTSGRTRVRTSLSRFKISLIYYRWRYGLDTPPGPRDRAMTVMTRPDDESLGVLEDRYMYRQLAWS